MSGTPQVRIAILRQPGSNQRGAGHPAVERLLSEWLGAPASLGHRADGSPILGDQPAVHISLSHATGATAVAIATTPVGIDIMEPSWTEADGRVAQTLFARQERRWLDRLDQAHRAAGFAMLWTLKEALMKRSRQGLDIAEPPNVSDLVAWLDGSPAPGRIAWRHWHDVTIGELVAPFRLLGGGPVTVAVLPADSNCAEGTIALSAAWVWRLDRVALDRVITGDT